MDLLSISDSNPQVYKVDQMLENFSVGMNTNHRLES